MRLQVCRSAGLQQVHCSVWTQLCKQTAVAIMLLGSTSQTRRGDLSTLISADKVTKAVARPWWEHNLMYHTVQHRAAKMENVFMSSDWPSPVHSQEDNFAESYKWLQL